MPDAAAKPRAGEVKPIPPRFWWLKRTAVAVMVILLGLAGPRWWWGWYANRQLQAEIDGYRVAGEPIYLTDFDPPPVADKDNAALALQKAAEGLAILTAKQTELVSDLLGGIEGVAQGADEARGILTATTRARTLARSSRSLPGTDWGVRLRSMPPRMLPPDLTSQRALCKVLWLAATYEHLKHNDAEAIESILDMLNQGERMDDQPFVLAHLVAEGIRGIGANALAKITPSLRIGDVCPTGQGAEGPAARRQVETVVRALLDDGRVSRAFARAMYGERALRLEMARSLGAGRNSFAVLGLPAPPGIPVRVVDFLIAPMVQLDIVRAMRYQTAQTRVLAKDDWVAGQRLSVSEPGSASALADITHGLTRLAKSSNDAIMKSHFHSLALRRMTAVALAIRMYELDHGRRAERLGELVPKYLPFLPKDPFASDGRPFGYNPRAEHPLLYSVGVNGVDEQGQYGLRDDGYMDRDGKDLPFFLDGYRVGPASATATSRAASTQAIKNQGNVTSRKRGAANDQRQRNRPQNR